MGKSAHTADHPPRRSRPAASLVEREMRERIEDALLQAEIDHILARLDVEIPKARKSMNTLLSRLRTTRIAA